MSRTPTDVAADWLASLDAALEAKDIKAATALFAEECFWRDFVAFTWNLKTFEGREQIGQMLTDRLDHVAPTKWALAEDATGDEESTEAWINFETGAATGYGHLRLRNGKCWTLLTTMRELKGFEERKGPRREKGVSHEIARGRQSWLERKQESEARLGYEEQPYCLIIGGGQGGIGLAARLRRQGVPTIVVEKNARAGDSWRNRYKSLHLHDPVWYDHLPYLKFPDDWPVFAAKDKIGDWTGKKAVVIGSNNSAHDICADLWEHGADVTMVQRSSTHISRSDTLMELGLGDLYSEKALANGVTTEKADLLFASLPYRILPDAQKPVYAEMASRDAKFYSDLAAAGFDLDFGEDGSGLFVKYLRRGSGYYIDVGASQLVIDGRVRLASGQVAKITGNAVVMADGQELEADLIVYATGYGSMNGWLSDLVSPEVADAVGKCWGYGSDTTRDPGPWEGELRNMWKPTNVENLWIHGGNLHQSRHYSNYLALQLKARMEGLDTPVYQLQESHHTR